MNEALQTIHSVQGVAMNVEPTDMKRLADAMLAEYGIIPALAQFGETYLHGGYEMDLMVWPEVDVYLLFTGFRSDQVYPVIQRLHECCPPSSVLVLNQVEHERRYGPGGCVIVDYRLVHAGLSWKLDLCMADKVSFAWVRDYNAALRQKMTPAQHAMIRNIKTVAVQSPHYRRANWEFIKRDRFFYSGDIYHAVLEHGVIDFDGFATHLERTRGFRLDVESKAGTKDGGRAGTA